MRYPKSIPKICARCGNKWHPKCCDYSYKAVQIAIDNVETISESNALQKLLEGCK